MNTPFETKSGVRPGCLLSPLLFLIVLDKVLRARLDGKGRGILWKFTETLEYLNYADDICLLSHSQLHMQSQLNNLCYESKNAGLEFNFSMTEELRVNTKSQHPIMFANKAIRRVHDFTYLGSNVSEDGGACKDVEARIQEVREAFTRLRTIWLAHYIKKDTKIKLFNIYVKSVLLYACQTSLVTYEIQRKLQSFVNRCLQYIMKIRWPRVISNERLWGMTGHININKEMIKHKFGWIRHALYKDDSEPCKIALQWNPQSTRGRGRPRNSW
jgi:hypothetical protein